MSLRQALEEYRNVYMPYRNFAERTREEYLNDLEDLVEFLEKSGINKLGKISLAPIERYFAELERRGFAGATRKRKTVAIRSFLTVLYRDGYLRSNIAKHLIPPFVEYQTPQFLTETECDRLREACAGNQRDRAIIEILLQSGLRLSELIRLTIDDIELSESSSKEHLQGAYFRIRGGRSRKDRAIRLNDQVCHAIKAYLEERPGTHSSVFFLNKFGQPFGDRGVQKMLSKYLKKTRLENASIHTLRHTFGVSQAAKGTNLGAIQEAMGLKDKRSASIYISLEQVIKSRHR